ncbi:MAG: hypothetical protein M3R38_00385 [Actinomycetota bacterium]|nr:hypothetical protein [Actinomycetota bacterium]
MTEAPFFDLGGTLTGTQALNAATRPEVFRPHGVEVGMDPHRNKLLGRSDEEPVRNPLPEPPIDEEAMGPFEAGARGYRRCAGRVGSVLGANAQLQGHGTSVGLANNAPREGTRVAPEAPGLGGIFAEEVGAEKPSRTPTGPRRRSLEAAWGRRWSSRTLRRPFLPRSRAASPSLDRS